MVPHPALSSRPSESTTSPEERTVGAEIWDEMQQNWEEKVGADALLVWA
jgi:hypothetical protein